VLISLTLYGTTVTSMKMTVTISVLVHGGVGLIAGETSCIHQLELLVLLVPYAHVLTFILSELD